MTRHCCFNYKDFYKKIVESNPNFLKFAEIGVYLGDSVSYLAGLLSARKGVKIIAVDLWDDSYVFEDRYKGIPDDVKKKMLAVDGSLYAAYTKTLIGSGVRRMITDIKCLSWDAAEKFEDNYFDFVFIDADHEYKSVKRDIEAWRPKVRPDGMLAGHDYGNSATGVKKAVDEIFPNADISGNVWSAK